MVLLRDKFMLESNESVALTFRVVTTGFTEDVATGNMQPNTSAVTIDVWMKDARSQDVESLPGIDVVGQPIRGRTKCGCSFPDGVRDQSIVEGTCSYKGSSGTIQLYIPNKRGASAKVGERFWGVFVRD